MIYVMISKMRFDVAIPRTSVRQQAQAGSTWHGPNGRNNPQETTGLSFAGS